LAELRDQFASWLQKIQDQLNLKADKSDFLALEKLMVARFEEMKNEIYIRLNEINIGDFYDKFAEKADTKKALKALEKQIKNLYELFMSLTGSNENTEDPMFSTKGLSCASCAKGLTNMLGKKAEFYTWNKMPYHDPGRRMLRVG